MAIHIDFNITRLQSGSFKVIVDKKLHLSVADTAYWNDLSQRNNTFAISGMINFSHLFYHPFDEQNLHSFS